MGNRHPSNDHHRLHHLRSNTFGTATLKVDVYKNYYKILDVKENASKKEIRSSYLKLAKKLHPDVHKNTADKKSAENKFIEAQEAYEVLHNQSKRAEYDELRRITLSQSRVNGQRMRPQTNYTTNHYDANVHSDYYKTKFSDSSYSAFGDGTFSQKVKNRGPWREAFGSHYEEMRDQEREEMHRIEKEWERLRRAARFNQQFEVPGWDQQNDERAFMENPYLRVARALFIVSVSMYVSRYVVNKAAYDPKYCRDKVMFRNGEIYFVNHQVQKTSKLRR